MSSRARVRLALALTALSISIVCVDAGLVYLVHAAPHPLTAAGRHPSSDLATSLIFALVGGLIAAKRPANLVGWGMLTFSIGMAAGDVLTEYAILALLARPESDLPLGAEAAALGAGSWTALMAGVFLVILMFPRGSLPSPRWSPVAKFVIAGFALIWLAIATSPDPFEAPLNDFENPLAITQSGVYLAAVVPVIAFCLLSTAAAALDLLMRFRRSRGEERQQYKWLAAAAALLIVTLPFAAAANYSGVPGAVMSIALLALPASVGIAVLRYHLYEIDRLINRTLVYGLLSAVLVALYAGLVIGLQELLQTISGGSDLAIVVTTLTVAALFLPARRRIQDVVDRRFNRRAYDAAKTIEAFGARLREQIDLDTLRQELLAVVEETMAPVHTTLWVRNTQ